jgi:phosphatidylserine/phosphatidylglycerophosphate/cardiolipin synthase-like enzyme
MRPNLIRRLAMCVAIAAVAAACDSIPDVVVPNGAAATPPRDPSRIYAASVSGSVRMEAHFTDLRGGITADRSLLDHVVHMINSAPAGDTIRAAIYALDVTRVREALQNAHDRQVRVFVVMDGRHHPGDPHEGRSEDAELLQAHLDGESGTNFRWCVNSKDLNPALAGWNGCIARAANASMHSKLILFSHTRDGTGTMRKGVVWFGSANLSSGSGEETYNNGVTVYGDHALYDGFVRRYWRALWAGNRGFPANDFYDRSRGRGFFIGSTFDLRVFASPEANTDLVVERLKDVETGKGCEIHLAQASFNNSRLDVARRLVRKKAKNCLVSVAVDSIGTEPLDTLLAAHIPVWCINTHDKFFIIKPGSRSSRRLVFTGSHNLTGDANYTNDELLVRLNDATMYEAFRDSWTRMTTDEDAYRAGAAGCGSTP